MNQRTKDSLAAGFLIIGILALLMNILLVVISKRLKRQQHVHVRLVTTLALLDIVMPTLAILASINYMVNKTSIAASFARGCAIKGTIDFFGMFLSMQFVFRIALERYYLLFYQTTIPNFIHVGLLFATGIYSTPVLVSAWVGEFEVLPNGIDCAPRVKSSISAAVSIAFLCLSLFLFLWGTVICYLRILNHAISTWTQVIDLATIPQESSGSIHFLLRPLSVPKRQRSVLIRTSIIILTYIAVVLPPCILLVYESVHVRKEVELCSIIIDLCLAAIALVNPCLVLFVHSIIFQQLTDDTKLLWNYLTCKK